MSHFNEITHRFLDYLRDDVDTSVSLGLPHHLHRLGDPSIDAHWQSVEKARGLLADLEASTAEDFYQSLDLDLMRRHLKRELFFKTLENHGELQRKRKPAGVDGISEGIFQLFVNDDRDSEARLTDILSRLRQAPDYLRTELSVLTTPVKRWRDIELEQAEEVPDLFDSVGKLKSLWLHRLQIDTDRTDRVLDELSATNIDHAATSTGIEMTHEKYFERWYM